MHTDPVVNQRDENGHATTITYERLGRDEPASPVKVGDSMKIDGEQYVVTWVRDPEQDLRDEWGYDKDPEYVRDLVTDPQFDLAPGAQYGDRTYRGSR